MRSFTATLLLLAASTLTVAQPPTPNAQLIATRNRLEGELEGIAIIERKVMVPMSDGKRMAADIYRPKDPSKKVPIIFVRTPLSNLRYHLSDQTIRNILKRAR